MLCSFDVTLETFQQFQHFIRRTTHIAFTATYDTSRTRQKFLKNILGIAKVMRCDEIPEVSG